jgi:hypothetical protein
MSPIDTTSVSNIICMSVLCVLGVITFVAGVMSVRDGVIESWDRPR